MSTKSFQPVTKPSTTVPKPAPSISLQSFIKDSFALSTLLALGAFVQAAVLLLLPARYALLPPALLLGRALITTVLAVRTPHAQLYPNVIPGTVTAQYPIPGDGSSSPVDFGSTAAAQPVLAFHLGVHINHPLGPLAPGGKEIGTHFRAMLAELQAHRDEYDALGFSQWRGSGGQGGRTSILLTGYFRSAKGLHRFAHGEVHRAGWNWYHRFVRETGYRHFGIFHESFLAQSGQWETIYGDCEPTLLGAAVVRVEQQEQQQQKGEQGLWVNPLVSTLHPALNTQAKRMPVALAGFV